MATIVAHHKVKDFDLWKPFYDRDIERRKAMGLSEVSLGRKAGDPNEVYIIWKTTTPERIKAMINDPDLKETMQKAGVISELEVVVLNDER